MRPFWNNLGDPGLHMLAIALLVVYLAFGRASRSSENWADTPLAYCKVCQIHFLPGSACNCLPAVGIAQAIP